MNSYAPASTTQEDTLKELATETPDLTALGSRFDEVVNQRDSNVFARAKLNYETRRCVWPGQTTDGRKWPADKSKTVFPWPGASDARVNVADQFINEDVAKLMLVWRRMKITVAGTESSDEQFATRLTQVLRWMKFTQMREARREMRLLANYMLERGSALLGVTWERVSQLGYQTITMEELANVPAAQGSGLTLGMMVQDPTMEEAAVELAQTFLPDLDKPRLRRILKELRETGTAEFPKPYVAKNRPVLTALLPNEDVFIPPEATEIQTASEIFRREVLTETQLRERVVGLGWDEKWVNEVIESQRGNMTLDGRTTGRLRGEAMTIRLRTSNLFEIIHAYTRRADGDGVPGVFYTVFHRGIQDSYGWHGLLNYEHGEYPFIWFELETKSRVLDDSRGYGERMATHQAAIKVQWDSRTDRTELATLPPLFHPPGLPPAAWGAGVKIGTNRREQYGFAEIPRYDPGSKEMEATIWDFVRRNFGRVVDPAQQAEALAVQQELVEGWMAGIQEADTQLLKLMQQFLPEEFYFRVVGDAKARSIRAKRDEIQGVFDISVSYSVSDLLPEIVQGKLKLVQEMLAWDTTGSIDRNAILQYAFDLLDPNLGERVLRPQEAAAQAEVDDEDGVFAKIFAGVPVDVRPGQAYDLRLQRLQQIMQQNPVAMARAQQDEAFRANVEKRIKQLSFQIEQRKNAQIGRLGA